MNTKILAGTTLAVVSVLGLQSAFAESQTVTDSPLTMYVGHGHRHGWHFTSEERTKLASMTDAEKQAFFAEKRASHDLEEKVIDKLLAKETLTDEEDAIREEIIRKRAQYKEQKAALEARKSEMQAILEKKKNNETLTADEQAKLDAHLSVRAHKQTKTGTTQKTKNTSSSTNAE